jgi:hypothetical protein
VCPEPRRILSLSIIPIGKVVSMPLMPCENIDLRSPISDLLSFAIYQKLMNYEVQVNISFLHVLVVIEKADPYFAYAKLSTPNNEPHQHHWKSRILK